MNIAKFYLGAKMIPPSTIKVTQSYDQIRRGGQRRPTISEARNHAAKQGYFQRKPS